MRIRDDVFAWMEVVEELRQTCALAHDESDLRDWYNNEINMIEKRIDSQLLSVETWIVFEATAEEQVRMRIPWHPTQPEEILRWHVSN